MRFWLGGHMMKDLGCETIVTATMVLTGGLMAPRWYRKTV